MGVVDTTSITQVIEWGKLATFVGFDTRISYRSKDPTLGSCKSISKFPDHLAQHRILLFRHICRFQFFRGRIWKHRRGIVQRPSNCNWCRHAICR